ncbi:hypothetical protein BJ170DRAFT_596901 [Xylariales sp. AK1849]|nr:hypothetical protein BJ170DRAFT_596901 [Xylariales sp. AK1849]
MCFREYVGYACGHSTIHILRPCPLTTHLHTNPVCPEPAERATHVNTMCPSCARILHTRWVEIVTLEHQWMHERGACGCPVQFPALQEPRATGGGVRGGGGVDEEGKQVEEIGLIGKSSNHISRSHGHTKTEGKAKATAQKPHALAWNNTLSPIVEIAEENGESTKVAVRLSSQYGAEWIPDHAKLHASGSCKCAVKFDTYKPHPITIDDVTPEAMATPIEALRNQSFRRSDLMIWRMNEENPDCPPVAWPLKLEAYGFKCVADAETFLADEEAARAEAPASQWASASGPGPVFDSNYQGSVGYTPTSYGEGFTASQASISVHQRPSNMKQSDSSESIVAVPGNPTYRQQNCPLIGWPIGAGPEGGMENSHSPAWNACGLSRPKLKKSRSCTW